MNKDNLFKDFPATYVTSDKDLAKAQASMKAKPQADLERSRELLASAKKTAESVTPWQRYRILKKSDPVKAGAYWRENEAAIKACR